jgi:hypothetical protein
MGKPDDSGRVILLASVERDQLRSALLALYRRQPRYDNIVRRDLSPRWKKFAGRYLGFDRWTRVHELRDEAERQAWREEDEGIRRDHDLADYLRYLDHCLVTPLGLTLRGQPSEWAAEYVHADAIGGYGPIPATWFSHWRGDMLLYVTQGSALVHATLPRGPEEETVYRDEVHSERFAAFDEWEQLRQSAYSSVDRLIARLREDYTAYHREHRAIRNLRNLHAQNDDLRRLFSLLFHRSDPEYAALSAAGQKALRQRLNALARKLDLDPPKWSVLRQNNTA